jgi:UDP-N-acetyl-D-mannosaminuronic acid dehydrogenase
MRRADRLTIPSDATLRQALQRLEETKEHILLCVDGGGRFEAVINDGDIRRALIAGAGLDDRVDAHMQREPLFVSPQVSFAEAMRYLSDRIRVLPVVDAERQIVGYYSQKEKQEFVDIKLRRVTVVGLGYVGLTLAVTLTDVGFAVVGFDVDEELVGKLRKGQAPFYEKHLQQYLDFHAGRNLTFASNLEDARSSIYIITVGTPLLKPSMLPNVEYLRRAAADVGGVLEPGDLVILRSTISVGCSREQVIPVLEAKSGLTVGRDFLLAYAPERTAEGLALQELRTNPQLIGGFDERSTELTSRVFNCITRTVIDVASLEAAELSKLLDNSYRDHKFAFVNQMARLTEKLGLDLCEIIDAVNFGYGRNNLPKPSPGVGGPCLSKDPYILGSVFVRHGLAPTLLVDSRQVNESMPAHLVDKLAELLRRCGKDIEKARIALLGFAFKGDPETSDLRDSTSLWFLDRLPSKNNVIGYDPVVRTEEIAALGIVPGTVRECFTDADAVVILNNHRSYRDLNVFELLKLMRRPAVFVDTWHVFNPIDIKRVDGIVYAGVGND